MKIRLIPFLLIFVVNVFMYSFASGQSAARNQNLIPSDFQKKMQDLPQAPVIDVRTPQEYSGGHIKNAININVNDVNFEKLISKYDKNKPILVYCLSGSRSAFAARNMQAAGFREVYNLMGGMIKWRSAGMPEVTSDNSGSEGLSVAQFNNLFKTDKLVLIDVYAEWCAPCKKMAPFLEEISKEMGSTVKIVKINADQNRSLMNELKITAIPTFLLYKNQKQVWSYSGFMLKDEITSILKKY